MFEWYIYCKNNDIKIEITILDKADLNIVQVVSYDKDIS